MFYHIRRFSGLDFCAVHKFPCDVLFYKTSLRLDSDNYYIYLVLASPTVAVRNLQVEVTAKSGIFQNEVIRRIGRPL
jgi:hypothetical protein